jgi:dTDP-4-dehydrorhamnose 3,5-epimerase
VKFTPTPLSGLVQVELTPIRDERGFFARAWCARLFAEQGLNPQLSQANSSFNRYRGTVRGLHYQLPPSAEAKLVRCIQGAIFDVAVDLRRNSDTFGQWFGAELSAENRSALYIPEGFAHGYQTLSDNAEVFYQVSAAYDGALERGLRFDDPTVAIAWPLPPLYLSAKDSNAPAISRAELP